MFRVLGSLVGSWDAVGKVGRGAGYIDVCKRACQRA